MAHSITIASPNTPPKVINSRFNIEVTVVWDATQPGGCDLKYVFLSPKSTLDGTVFYSTDYNVTKAVTQADTAFTEEIAVPSDLYNAILVVTLIQTTLIPGSPPTVMTHDTKSTGPYTFKALGVPPPPPPNPIPIV